LIIPDPDRTSPSVTLEALQPRLQRFFAARSVDASVRDELVSRVNERITRRSSAEVGTPIERIEDLERFAFGVARLVLMEYFREAKRTRRREATLSPTVENLGRELTSTIESGVVSRGSLLRALTDCLAELPEAERAIADRCYGDGKSKDVRAALSIELGVSRNALDARISRIRARLEACVRLRLRLPNG
jgi:DNA-directed RNA polymerase specialized sigma24 family protein